LWDLVEKEGLSLLPNIAKATQDLPTTSSDVEQAFSYVKLIKTEKRSRLKEQTLEAILLIWSFFKNRRERKTKTIAVPVQSLEKNSGSKIESPLLDDDLFHSKNLYDIKITENMLSLLIMSLKISMRENQRKQFPMKIIKEKQRF